jgi:hypothetical protein
VLIGIGLVGVHLSIIIPVWAGLVFAAIFFFMPDVELRGQVEKRQRDFRHAIGAFLDLVAMNLSGGRGVPELLVVASCRSPAGGVLADQGCPGQRQDHRPDAVAGARRAGRGSPGERAERPLGRAQPGGRGRGQGQESLTARAVRLRRRELADLEGQAGEKSQSMLLAQMLLAAAFLVFLMYPAVHLLLQA